MRKRRRRSRREPPYRCCFDGLSSAGVGLSTNKDTRVLHRFVVVCIGDCAGLSFYNGHIFGGMGSTLNMGIIGDSLSCHSGRLQSRANNCAFTLTVSHHSTVVKYRKIGEATGCARVGGSQTMQSQHLQHSVTLPMRIQPIPPGSPIPATSQADQSLFTSTLLYMVLI